MKRHICLLAFGLFVVLSHPSVVLAGNEWVVLSKVMDDKAIVSRSDSSSYLIEPGVGCLSLWRFEGKKVLINSPGMFLGIGSKLILPDAGQECRIWDSEELGSGTRGYAPSTRRQPPATPTSVDSMSAVSVLQSALRLLGYRPGNDPSNIDEQTATALSHYQVAKGLPADESGMRLAINSLALDLLKRNRDTNALMLSVRLMEISRQLNQPQVPPPPTYRRGYVHTGCDDGHWVQQVIGSGEFVKLEDGSLWQIDSVDRIDTSLWLPTDDITICGDYLINTDDNEKVQATRVR